MLEIAIGPPHIAINQGHTILVTEPDGQIHPSTQKGLYFFDTRLISNWRVYANGEAWELLNGGNLYHYASRVFLTNPAIPTENCTIAPHALQLALSRSIGGGMHEDLDLINHGTASAEFNLEILIHSDFADLFEVKSGRIVQRRRVSTEWSAEERIILRTIYRNRDFCRGSVPLYANGRLRFPMAPGQAWHSYLLHELGDGKVRTKAPARCIAQIQQSKLGKRLEHWKTTVLKIETDNELFLRSVRAGN